MCSSDLSTNFPICSYHVFKWFHIMGISDISSHASIHPCILKYIHAHDVLPFASSVLGTYWAHSRRPWQETWLSRATASTIRSTRSTSVVPWHLPCGVGCCVKAFGVSKSLHIPYEQCGAVWSYLEFSNHLIGYPMILWHINDAIFVYKNKKSDDVTSSLKPAADGICMIPLMNHDCHTPVSIWHDFDVTRWWSFIFTFVAFVHPPFGMSIGNVL